LRHAKRGIEPLVFIEAKLDYSHIAPEGFGTGDCVILGGGELHVMDFQAGSGYSSRLITTLK
jgi:hypothetical protein